MCKLKKYQKSNPRIDKCMREEIKEWNRAIKLLRYYIDIKIVACCCGHRKYKKTIVLREGTNTQDMNPMYFEHFSRIEIPRKRNFYKRDKQGYYYIPEIENERKEM